MTQSRRQWGAVAIVCAAAFCLRAATSPEGLLEQKEHAIKATLDAGAQVSSREAVLAALPEAAALTGVDVIDKAGVPSIEVSMTGPAACSTLLLEGGKQLVVDLDNSVNLYSGDKALDNSHPLVAAVRASQHALEPAPSTRLVFDLSVPCTFTTSEQNGRFEINVRAKDAGMAALKNIGKGNSSTASTLRIQVASTRQHTDTAIAALESQLKHLRSLPSRESGRNAKYADHLVGQVEAGLAALKKTVTAEKEKNDVERLAMELQAVTQPKIELFRADFAVNAMQDDREFGIPDPAAQDERERENPERYVPTVGIDTGDEDADRAPARTRATDSGADTTEAPAEEEAADVPEDADAADPAADDATAQDEDSESEEAEGEAGEGEDSEGEEAEGEGETGLLEPPAPRVTGSGMTGDANAEISSKRLSLDASDPAVLSAQGVSEAGAPLSTAPATGDSPPPPPAKPYTGNPLDRRVNLDFREMELSNVVALLGHMAGINVIAGTDITGTVTANMQNVPLRQAMQTVLRMNNLGMIEEEGIYLIVPYEEAIAAQRVTSMITLQNAKARDVQQVLDDIVQGSRDRTVTVSANDAANIIVLSGPEARIANLVTMAHQLDVAEPVLPTVTEPIKLNYAEPGDIVDTIEKMLTPEIGQVAVDERARHIVVTDEPLVVEQVRALVQQLDLPVKQVAIDAMVVDVNLEDGASTGVDWLLNAVRRQSRRDAALGTGEAVGNLQELGLDTNLGLGPNSAGVLAFELLSSDINWQGVIQAEVRNFNGELVSNPVLVTVENKPAMIEIVREIPYVELTQTAQGGSQTSTEFKIVGTVLSVTPRVTHTNDIIVDLEAKESDTSGEFNGVPIEDKREIETTLLVKNGQTIFTGGLRKSGKDTTVRKIPVLGDVPVVNFLFRQNQRTDEVNELLIFMTCRVVEEKGLTPYQETVVEKGQQIDMQVDGWNALVNDAVYPAKMRDPMWKWRRAE